jgi:hypothetical protein
VNGKVSFPGHYVRAGDTIEHRAAQEPRPPSSSLAGEHCVYIFRLHGPMRQPLLHCGGLAPVFPLLCNPRQAKVGVAVRDDVKNPQARAPSTASRLHRYRRLHQEGGASRTPACARRRPLPSTGR